MFNPRKRKQKIRHVDARTRKSIAQIGGWLPKNQEYLKKWLDDLIKEAEKKYSTRDRRIKLDGNFRITWDIGQLLHPLIREFMEYVDSDATLHMQYKQMFSEVTHSETPAGTPQVQNYHTMFFLVNFIMMFYAPQYKDHDLVGFPINVILNWSMGTINGYAAFLHQGSNEYWKKVLDTWGEFLESDGSTFVLNSTDNGWFGEPALKAMKLYTFEEFARVFKCDPDSPPHYGYTSWDSFFIRKFNDGIRPIASPDDKNVIVSACESKPFDLQYDVQYRDDFWIKEQPYSLRHMLNEDEYTKEFVGGTIYQAFLSALNYHRWHSPIDGTIVKAYVVPGTYYSATLAVGEDTASPDLSQGYICQVAARAIIFIQADNPNIGLMCFVAVGMSEVSTCEILADLIPKQGGPAIHVSKGQEIGMFHFGGSTHCLLFRPGVNVEFEQKVIDSLESDEAENILLNSKLATVIP